MSINNQTTIQELLDQGLFTDDQVIKLRARAARNEKRAAAQQLALLESDVQSETKYFSVKKTANSVGFMDFVETDRATVLKALTLLVSQDKIKKIGLVGGEEKLASEVNAFQIRYTRA
jgi:predicted RNA binding protein with dsRBD fold (UPF0201 family)